MQNRPLKLQNVLANPPHRRQKSRISRRMRVLQLTCRNPNRLRRQFRPIQLLGILQHRRQTARPHLSANPLHHLLWRQRLAKHLHRPPPTRLAHHIPRRTQLRAQGIDASAHVTLSRINPLNLKQSHRYRSLTQNQECEQKETKEKTQLSTERKRVLVPAAVLRFLRFLLLNYACSLTDKSPSDCVRL